MQFVKVNTTGAQPYQKSQTIQRAENCAGFIATNTGSVPVRVNGRILYPGTPGTNNGDSFTFGCNYLEIYTGNIDIMFDSLVGAEVTIEQKFYDVQNVDYAQ